MITSTEMRKLEDLSELNGVSKLQLMENAGKGFYELLKKDYTLEWKKILVLCGQGNNGGDGFVIARYLIENSYDVEVMFIGMENRLKYEAKENYLRLNKDIFVSSFNAGYDLIVDALLGTGIKGELREPYPEIIKKVNDSDAIVISVDVPSGMDPDTGEVITIAVDAEWIYTFHDIKPGINKEKTKIIDIGIRAE